MKKTTILIIAFTTMILNGANVSAQKATSAPRLSVEGKGDDAKLTITTDACDGGVFFKYGSVVALYSGSGGENLKLPSKGTVTSDYRSSDVAFNPTQTKEFAFSDIPYAKGSYNINTSYHTLANVQAGKGDPCRLVGYTAREVREAVVVPDNGMWRMPTHQENVEFSGCSNNIMSWNGQAPFWWTNDKSPFDSVAGAEFPKRGKGGADKFLPAVGSRSGDGSLRGANYIGWYGSADYMREDSSSKLMFYYNPQLGSFLKLNGGDREYALSVRCVRQ